MPIEQEQKISAEASESGAKSRTVKILTGVVVAVCIVALLGVFLLVWYFGDRYEDFERRFTQESEIPALDEGFIPQGLGNNPQGTVQFVSGYMNDGSPSRIYVLEDGETVGYVTFTLSDGSYYTGHAGGVASNGSSKVWIASGETMYVLDYDDVLEAAENNGTVALSTSWSTYCDAAFCYYSPADGYIYVGEFYRAGNYETDESHRFTTPAGDENNALILRYSASSTRPSAPSRAFSITGEIQGMAMSEDRDRIILSQSYGLKNSHILTYSYSSTTAHKSSALTINGTSVTVYYLDSANLISDYEIPCMSEGLCADGDKIYVLFESASVKYRAFVRERLNHIYSFRVPRS